MENTHDQFRELIHQNEAGEARRRVLEKQSWGLGKVIAERTSGAMEKGQTMEMGLSEIGNV